MGIEPGTYRSRIRRFTTAPQRSTYKIQCAPSEDSDQTAHLRTQVWVFAWCTCNLVRNVVLRLVCQQYSTTNMCLNKYTSRNWIHLGSSLPFSARLVSQICTSSKFNFHSTQGKTVVFFHRYSTENILTFIVWPVASSKLRETAFMASYLISFTQLISEIRVYLERQQGSSNVNLATNWQKTKFQ